VCDSARTLTALGSQRIAELEREIAPLRSVERQAKIAAEAATVRVGRVRVVSSDSPHSATSS
jgi:hypothetical protein